MSMFDDLAAPFANVHWRAQSMNRDGTSALALAYIDARDVMDRFDAVCGPHGWQNDYVETARGRVIGKISVLVNGEWITKADGAGDTDVEGEKGGISDALKRAAVLWGVGRYLYRLPATWADCEPIKDRDGKLLLNKAGKPQWKCWTADGLKKLQRVSQGVGGAAIPSPPPKADTGLIDDAQYAELTTLARAAQVDVGAFLKAAKLDSLDQLPADHFTSVRTRWQTRLANLTKKEAA